jgi:response regulator NasT
MAARDVPDLALLDVRMPGMDGVELGKRLREQGGIPFLYLSAYGDRQNVREAVEGGALGYLVKPLDVRQIVPAVRAALARTMEAKAAAAPAAAQGGRDEFLAIGILMERLRLDYDRALEALRAQAKSENRGVGELASSMVEAANRLNSIRR